MSYRWSKLAFVGLALSLGACSSIVEGTTQTVTVITDPPGATCNLIREGTIVAVANPTPASVVLDKSKNDVSVICTLEDHFEGAETLVSGFEGMTFGNILFGGIIGVGVDAASGALNKYPETIIVVLPPESFSDTMSRDQFFDRQIARVTQEATAAVAEVARNCNPNNQDCDALVKAIEEDRDAKIERFNVQRDQAVVSS